jgi:hypothetical protein
MSLPKFPSDVAWEKFYSESEKRFYYYNSASRTATWIVPPNHPDHPRYESNYGGKQDNKEEVDVKEPRQPKKILALKIVMLWYYRKLLRILTSSKVATTMVLLSVIASIHPTRFSISTNNSVLVLFESKIAELYARMLTVGLVQVGVDGGNPVIDQHDKEING